MADDRRAKKRRRGGEIKAGLRSRSGQPSAGELADHSDDPPATDAAGGKSRIKDSDITGLKYFDQRAPLLEHLHDDACQRDKASNRELHFDQYCLLILLYLFSPVVTSLRGIQQASELQKVRKKLGCSRASLGSLSEAGQCVRRRTVERNHRAAVLGKVDD